MMQKRHRRAARRFGELFNRNIVHNAHVLMVIASTDVFSTYLCIKAGLYEANPIVRTFYSIGLQEPYIPFGLIMHLLLYAFITYFIAWAAKYLSRTHKRIAHMILIGYSAFLLVVAFNNMLLLTIHLLKA